MYIQNPDQPQYIISVFLKYLDIEKHKLAYVAFFGVVELTLATINWSLVLFFVSFPFGCASTIKSKLDDIM